MSYPLDTFGALVATYRRRKGWTQSQLGAEVGTSRKTISNIENNQRVNLSAILFQKIIETLEIPFSEIPRLTRPEISDQFQVREHTREYPDTISSSRLAPVLTCAGCGQWTCFADLEHPKKLAERFEPTSSTDPHAFYIRAEGESMAPRIQPGDLVLIEPNQPVTSGDIVLACTDTDCSIKKYIKMQDGHILLLPLNGAFEPREFNGKTPIQCYKAVSIVSRL